MEDDKEKTVETTTEPDSKAEENKDTDTQIDYDKEFEEEVNKFETAEKNREGYQKRKGAKETTEEEVDKTETKLLEDEDKVEELVAKAIKKQLPKLQSSLVEDTVENALNELSQGNEAKKKLIRFHFENSVAPNGTIRERMENALLIAEKKTIFKTQKEMAVALKNRQGLSSSGLGTSTEGVEVKDNYFSKEQLASLKARGWDDKKIERLKANLQK